MLYSIEKIKTALGCYRDAVKIIIEDLVPSTNDMGKEIALSERKENTLILAYRQDKGKGRMGRNFFSPEGGIYMSLVISETGLSPEEIPLITPAAAVAVCRAIEELTPAKTKIKWVNDIFVDGGKACGILTESVFSGDSFFSVVGIGINLLPQAGGFPDELRGIASSVYSENQAPAKNIMNQLVGTIVRELLDQIKLVPSRDFSEEYRRRSFVIGKDVKVIQNGISRDAHVVSIDDDCRLGVKYQDGREEFLFGGEISLRF
ncbi:MAG: biotin--[Clostridia bacterium]|nr:biotin--[acetyl-CoA-carboxylase] ligase [Clostridia bacterium]